MVRIYLQIFVETLPYAIKRQLDSTWDDRREHIWHWVENCDLPKFKDIQTRELKQMLI